MKELGDNLAKLAAIIMFMITLAISTAALSQWASPDAGTQDDRVEQSNAGLHALSASATQ